MEGRRTAKGETACGIGLLSGGLDSMLAARVLMEQGVRVVAVVFKTPFFGGEKGEKAASILGLKAHVLDITVPHLAMVKNPPHGYGRNMNPCIDCHAMMFAQAGALLEREGAQFLFSGEVLGQRPMSQNAASLRLVGKASGFEELILRPLSARLLPETRPEREGVVDRAALLDIQGRSRRRQMELAQWFGLREYPGSGGGCLLTDPGFSSRLKDLFLFDPTADSQDVERLKVGRHFRLPGGAKAIVGRNSADNDALERLARGTDLIMTLSGPPGPTTLLTGGAAPGDVQAAAALTVRYGKAAGEGPFAIDVQNGQGNSSVIHAFPMKEAEVEAFRVG